MPPATYAVDAVSAARRSWVLREVFHGFSEEAGTRGFPSPSFGVLDPNQNVGVDVRQVESMTVSETSMMPTGLIDRLNQEEVLDLLAYLLSGGNPDHPFFQGARP